MREEIVDAPAPQIQGQIHEIGKVIPQERVSERVVKQIVNIPVPQIKDETVEAIQLVPEEQTAKYIDPAATCGKESRWWMFVCLKFKRKSSR